MREKTLFVGKSHHAAVRTLVECFQRLSDSGPRFVCLVAPPGWGKTRVIQEFYATLATSQPAPPYWPPDLDRNSGPEMRSILEGRKRLYPTEVVVPDGASLPWFWWAILCQRRLDGTFSQAIFDDATQLYAHADSILGRIGIGETAARTFDASNSLIGLIGSLGVALFPPAGIALGVAGAARTGWQNRDLVAKIKEVREKRAERPIDATSYGRVEQVEEIASQLIDLSHTLPIVVVVDDAHYADDTLVETIDFILKHSSGQVLIVATAWPQELDDTSESAPFPAWWTHSGRGGLSERISRIDLELLDKDSAAQLILADIPSGDPELAAWIIERWGTNPLVLRTLVRLPRVKTALARGEMKESVSRLPQQIEAILGEYWSNLPDEVQGILALASRLGMEFVPTVVAGAAASVGTSDGTRAVTEAVSPYAWVREHDVTLHGFVEAPLWQVACRGAEDLLGQTAIESLSKSLESAVQKVTDSEPLPPERTLVTLWQQHTNFVGDGCLPANTLAACSAISLAERLAVRLQFGEAVRLVGLALKWGSFSTYETAVLRRSLGGWLRQAGRFPEAMNELKGSVTSLENSGARLEAARARRDLGDTYRYLGHLDAAVECFEVALATFEVEGDMRAAASALNGLGDASRGLSRWEQSQGFFRRCMDIYRQIRDERELARSQVRYGMVFRDRWQNAHAVREYMEALSVFRRIGDRRWEARAMRNLGVVDRNERHLAAALGRFDECAEIFDELRDERGFAVTLRNRGDTFRLLEDFDSAERDLNGAMEIFKRIDDRRWGARAQLSIGDMRRRQGRWSAAQTLIFAARNFYSEIGDTPGEGRALRAQGLLLRDSRQLDDAAAAFEESQRLFEQLGDTLWFARALSGLASVARARNEADASVENRVRAICRELGAVDEETQALWLAEW